MDLICHSDYSTLSTADKFAGLVKIPKNLTIWNNIRTDTICTLKFVEVIKNSIVTSEVSFCYENIEAQSIDNYSMKLKGIAKELNHEIYIDGNSDDLYYTIWIKPSIVGGTFYIYSTFSLSEGMIMGIDNAHFFKTSQQMSSYAEVKSYFNLLGNTTLSGSSDNYSYNITVNKYNNFAHFRGTITIANSIYSGGDIGNIPLYLRPLIEHDIVVPLDNYTSMLKLKVFGSGKVSFAKVNNTIESGTYNIDLLIPLD